MLILEGKGYFRGLGLVEVLWKAIANLIKRSLTAVIFFHNTLHGFRAGRGAGTADLVAKILQQSTAMRELVLFEVFLDIQKAYNNLDRERVLELLISYAVAPRMVQLLRN